MAVRVFLWLRLEVLTLALSKRKRKRKREKQEERGRATEILKIHARIAPVEVSLCRATQALSMGQMTIAGLAEGLFRGVQGGTLATGYGWIVLEFGAVICRVCAGFYVCRSSQDADCSKRFHLKTFPSLKCAPSLTNQKKSRGEIKLKVVTTKRRRRWGREHGAGLTKQAVCTVFLWSRHLSACKQRT